jgi:hypothetical protein
MTSLDSEVIWVGEYRSVVVPSPSWPSEFAPQQYVELSIAKAQE